MVMIVAIGENMTVATKDFLSQEQRRDLMRRIKSTNTKAELTLQKSLERLSLRFECNCADLPGKPDIVFRSRRLAIFVDGEFWHGRQWYQRKLSTLDDQFPDPLKRAKWIKKIRGNITRDFRGTAELLANKWSVMRFWESDIEKSPDNVANAIGKAVRGDFGISAASMIATRSVAEFFAGIGLARLGLNADGWNVVFANDNAEEKHLFYETNFGGTNTHLDKRDIHSIQSSEIPVVTLATACFPCTDLSLAGDQRGLTPGTESSAYLKFASLLSGMGDRRPPFVLLENVVGMIHSRKGVDFKICLEQLQSAGYKVDCFAMDAKWFVPQSRPRLFVVAVRNDLEHSGHFDAVQVKSALSMRPTKLIDFISSHPELSWSLRPLSPPKPTNITLREILEKIPAADKRWWPDARAKKLYDQMSAAHQEIVKQMMASKRPMYGTVFRRMRNDKSTAEIRTDGIAGCLRTPKGGSGRQILLKASNGKYSVRLLTPRECARLMGADDLKIPDSMSLNTALFAFGDGVCVPVVKWIAENYLTPLACELIRGRVLQTP